MNVHKYFKKLKGLFLGAVVATVMIGSAVTAMAGDYLWPTPGIDYWYRGFGKNGHQGMDIAANDGVEIFSAGNGVVMEVYTGCNNYDGADAATGGVPCNQTGKCNPSKSFYKDGFCNSAYGNAVIIKHDTGIWSSYAHLSGIADGIKVGTRVTAGQLVGCSGSTGRSTGVHLHFEMRSGTSDYFWLNKAFDPLTLVTPQDVTVTAPTPTPVPTPTPTPVPNPEVGDVDRNGVINSADALMILQKSAGMRVFDDVQLQLGDVTGNGIVNAEDALVVLQIAAGIVR